MTDQIMQQLESGIAMQGNRPEIAHPLFTQRPNWPAGLWGRIKPVPAPVQEPRPYRPMNRSLPAVFFIGASFGAWLCAAIVATEKRDILAGRAICRVLLGLSMALKIVSSLWSTRTVKQYLTLGGQHEPTDL